jgi:coenzyme PQQ synthesis protein D (PqqD)
VTLLRLREDEVAWREVGGDIVALEARRSAYLTMNSAGALLWRVLSEGATRGDLVDTLTNEYGLDVAAAGRDVDGFIASLRAHDLLLA